MASVLNVRVASATDALDRFEAAWNHLEEGGRLASERVLTFAELPLLVGTLTPARWALLERLRAEGPLSVYRLAKRLGRDYKNVHTDVARLTELGLIARRGHARVAVDWDAVRAELRLAP